MRGRRTAARILAGTGALVVLALLTVHDGPGAAGGVPRQAILPTAPPRPTTTAAPAPTAAPDTSPPATSPPETAAPTTTVPPTTAPPPTTAGPTTTLPPPSTAAPTTAAPSPASSTTVAPAAPRTSVPQTTTTLAGPVPTVGSASPGGLFTPRPTELVLSPLAVLRKSSPGPSLVSALVIGIPGVAALALALRHVRRPE